MQPNNSYQPPQVPHDYLNQIAAPAQVKTINPFILWGLIGGLLVLAVLVLIGVSSASKGPSSSSLASVAAKLDNLKNVSEDAQKNIKSSELRTLNSNLTLSLTNTNRDLEAPLKSQDISLKDKKNKSIVVVNKDFKELEGRLEDARLNAVYDRTYAREMLYALKTLRSDMAIIYKKSKSKDLRTTLDTTNTNLKPIIDGLGSFNAS